MTRFRGPTHPRPAARYAPLVEINGGADAGNEAVTRSLCFDTTSEPLTALPDQDKRRLQPRAKPHCLARSWHRSGQPTGAAPAATAIRTDLTTSVVLAQMGSNEGATLAIPDSEDGSVLVSGDA